jgi:hydrogenase-4 membrane subunit HyfE
MTGAVIWGLVVSALAVVVVRRRSLAITFVALQSLVLGVYAITRGSHTHAALTVTGIVLIVKALVLPALLLFTVRRARKARPIATESPALARLAIAVAVALAVEQLIPRVGLPDAGVEHAAVGMLALGIATAVVRRAVLFQALGFLIAESGIYLAGLSLRGGLPGFIELGLVFDLVVIVSVAAAFTAKIHEQLGSGDSSLLGVLRD